MRLNVCLEIPTEPMIHQQSRPDAPHDSVAMSDSLTAVRTSFDCCMAKFKDIAGNRGPKTNKGVFFRGPPEKEAKKALFLLPSHHPCRKTTFLLERALLHVPFNSPQG